MREIRQSGSVRGVRRNLYPYRDAKLLHFLFHFVLKGICGGSDPPKKNGCPMSRF